VHGKPEIVNSDQGSQFTCPGWVAYLEGQEITISMDGRGRALDNVWIERFWHTLKQEYVYICPAENGNMLRKGLKKFISYYNNRRIAPEPRPKNALCRGMSMQPDLFLLTPKVAFAPEPVKAVTSDLKVGLDRTQLRHKEWFTMATN